MAKIIEFLKNFMIKSKRVWLIMRKPTRKEIELTSKISALGILLLGLFGFAISIIMSYLV